MKSHKKGAIWERNCSRMFSLWLTGGERDDVVWRTPGSGGRHTARAKHGREAYNQAGDLCGLEPSVQYFFDRVIVECKKGYSTGVASGTIDVLHGLDQMQHTKKPLLLRWWDKASEERVQSKRQHVLIVFRRYQKRACILIEKRWMVQLSAYNGRYPHGSVTMNFVDYPILSIYAVDDWLDWCNPETIKLVA